MPKINSESRITDNKGTAAFHSYCANHKPAISWRGIPNDDIGIDGEVELYNKDGEPLAEIIKVQLKSTERSKGYIQNENPINKTFTFYAEKAHVEYWQELPNDVILIIYDNRNSANKIYAKKVENIDLRNIGTIKVPIQFHQENDWLDPEKNDFLEKFSRSVNKSNPKIKPIRAGHEKLVTNLLRINFTATDIFVAPINYDREEIIKKSWKTDRQLKIKAGAREVAQSALYQKGLKFSSDWTIFNNNIITFHDLNDKNLPISKIIDTSSVERLSIDEFYSIDDDYKSVFKTLLRFCMQQLLFRKNFTWDNEDRIFKYIVPERIKLEIEKLSVTESKGLLKGTAPKGANVVHKESWKGQKTAQRTVLKANYWDKGRRYYCTHFSFGLEILDFNDIFYLCINPTWLITVNGIYKSKIGHKKVSQLKKLERNPSVYNHLRFIAYKLIYTDLFVKEYAFLNFHSPEKLEIDKIVDELSWLATEEQEEKELFEDKETPNELINEY